MNKCISFFLILIFESCGLIQNNSPVKIQHFNLTQETKIFTDSLLIHSKIDTVLVFKIGCSGCIEGSVNLVYIYWKKNRICKLRKLSNNGFLYEINTKYNLLEYYYDHENDIQISCLNEPNNFIHHFKYTDITLYSGAKRFYKNITESYLFINQNTAIVNWIKRIESDLFKIENAY